MKQVLAKYKKEIVIFFLFIIVLAVLLFLLTRPSTESSPEINGFGNSNEPILSYPAIPDQFEIKNSPSLSPDGSGEFELVYENLVKNNGLTIKNTTFEAKAVVAATWSTNSERIVYTVAEKVDEAIQSMASDAGKLFVVKKDGTENKEVYNFESPILVAFVSNGKSIGYVSDSEVGVIDITKGEKTVLYQFNMNTESGDDHDLPEIFAINSDKFGVKIPNGEQFEQFNFDF